jgi:polyribonucleotide nucleotidyltransferase
MDADTIKLLLSGLNILLTLALWIFALYNQKHSATNQAIKDLEKSVADRFSAKCERISKVEAGLKAFPSREELVRIHERIDDMQDEQSKTNLLIGQVLGQLKQMNFNKSGRAND